MLALMYLAVAAIHSLSHIHALRKLNPRFAQAIHGLSAQSAIHDLRKTIRPWIVQIHGLRRTCRLLSMWMSALKTASEHCLQTAYNSTTTQPAAQSRLHYSIESLLVARGRGLICGRGSFAFLNRMHACFRSMSKEHLESECLKAFKRGNKRDVERLLLQVRQPADITITSDYAVIVNHSMEITVAMGSSLVHLAAAHAVAVLGYWSKGGQSWRARKFC